MLEQPGRRGDAATLAVALERLLAIGEGAEAPETPSGDAPGAEVERYRYWYEKASTRFPDLDGLAADHANGWVQDDIADIAQDVEICLRLQAAGQSQTALWEWRFGLEVHWGDHARHLLAHLRHVSHPLPPINPPSASR